MSALWGWAAIVVCCAPAHSDDSFQKRLARDCATEATCRVFTSEAENRARHCRSEAECTQARSDAALANAQLSERIRERESADAETQADRSARSKQDQEAHDREVAEYASKRQEQRAERERSKQEASDREAAQRRFLGPEGRKKELVSCYESHPPIECADTVAKLLAAATDDRERKSLIALNEKTLQRLFDKAHEPFAGQILCCDGAVAATCGCGGKLKNCCTRRGGVCGCAALPTAGNQAANP
jgi:hypothetical protein